MSAPFDYDQLTPGIREVVRLLREHGFDTTDSGDGVTNVALDMEGAIPVPHVHCVVDPRRSMSEGGRLFRVLREAGLSPGEGTVQITLDPASPIGTLSVTGIDDAMLAKARAR